MLHEQSKKLIIPLPVKCELEISINYDHCDEIEQTKGETTRVIHKTSTI